MTDDDSFRSYRGRSSSTSSFYLLSPPSDRRCEALGFVLAGHYFELLKTLEFLGCKPPLMAVPPVHLLGHFPPLQWNVRDAIQQEPVYLAVFYSILHILAGKAGKTDDLVFLQTTWRQQREKGNSTRMNSLRYFCPT